MSKLEKYILGGVAALLLVLLIILGIVSLTQRNKKPAPPQNQVIVEQFSTPAFDANAISGKPEGMDEPSYQKLQMLDFSFQMFGEPIIEENELVLYLTNLTENPAWIKVKLYDENGGFLGESGVVRIGEYVRSVHTDAPLTAGQHITAKLFFYEPETYYSKGTFGLQLVCK